MDNHAKHRAAVYLAAAQLETAGYRTAVVTTPERPKNHVDLVAYVNGKFVVMVGKSAANLNQS